jgi:hypothetical protein
LKRGLLLLLLAGCAAPAPESEGHKVELPAYPRERDLIEFKLGAPAEFRFFVDGASVSVARDVTYYTLVARSPAGVDNVSFEAMRCSAVEVRTYALGRNGAWTEVAGEWRSLRGSSVQRWHNELYREYFCPQREALASRQLVLLALRRGGPSITNSLTEDTPRGNSGSGW